MNRMITGPGTNLDTTAPDTMAGEARPMQMGAGQRVHQLAGWCLRGVWAVTLLFCLVACGGSNKTVWDGPPKSKAEVAYRDALELMESSQYIEATKRFNKLRLDFPFSSRWTTLAELRLADALLEQSRYAAAAESYRQFINSHPTHEEVPYAQFKVGVCYYEQMPTDFFMWPEPWQRELNSASQAQAAFARFLKAYPEHANAPEAVEMLSEARRRLALHELYVAEFYLKRDAVIGAMNRLETLVRDYPDTQAAEPGLFLLAKTYILQNDVPAAAGALQRLVVDHEASTYAVDARAWLVQHGLQDTQPTDFRSK